MKQLLVATLLFLSSAGYSQELNCQVTIINDSRMEITTVEKEIFEQMKQTIYELMNNTKWTKDKFKVEERINCQIQLQINSIPTPGTYEGSLQIQSSRPVFNGSYNTTLFNFQDDDIAFTYARNAVLIYAPNQFRDNLTSVLAFYAYYIIGMDYDSFSLKGGTPYFTEAQQIVSNAQAAGGKGWKSNEQGKRNRYWLVDNIQQQLFEPLRECLYEYHRKGMDMLFENKDTGRKNVYAALNKLSKVSSTRPNSVNVLNFAQAKLRELKELYQDATPAEKTEVVTVLKRIDPANSSKYEEILN
ncbi:MAG: DUF4835 family protein [Bacteroidota bacterium]